jgi:hypothetical protein
MCVRIVVVLRTGGGGGEWTKEKREILKDVTVVKRTKQS